MTSDLHRISLLLRQSGLFPHIWEIGSYVFVANNLNDLTGVCIPSTRARRGEVRLDIEIGLVVAGSDENTADIIKKKISKRQFVSLPKSIPASHSLDMMIQNQKITDWALRFILAEIDRYCLPKNDALSLINSEEDEFLERIRAINLHKFEEAVIAPLCD